MLRLTGTTTRKSGVALGTVPSRAGANKSEKIEVENINHPGQVTPVDADMYKEIKQAFLKVLPNVSPGLTEVEIRNRIVAHLSQKLFPNGAKVGWWTKTVQLDLEAKGIVAREKGRPLRWHKA